MKIVFTQTRPAIDTGMGDFVAFADEKRCRPV